MCVHLYTYNECLCTSPQYLICVLCMHTYIHACIHTCLHTYIHTYIHAYIHTYIHTSYIHTYIHTYMHACMHACIHTYVRTSIHPSIHTYIRTYVRTYIHTHIHTYYIHACTTYTSYSTSCQKLILSVCEELMLPVPVELCGSPASSPHETCIQDSPTSSEIGSLHSLPEISSTTATVTHRLVCLHM